MKKKIADDYIAVLAMVLILPDHKNLIKLPSIVRLSKVNPRQVHSDSLYNLLLVQLNSCITLNYTFNKIESSLYSIIFKLMLPYKLVEA